MRNGYDSIVLLVGMRCFTVVLLLESFGRGDDNLLIVSEPNIGRTESVEALKICPAVLWRCLPTFCTRCGFLYAYAVSYPRGHEFR
jgi:hypothetical protein